MYRAIPCYGFCTVDLPRESAGYRSLFAGQPDKAVQHGFLRARQTFETGRHNEARNWHIWEDLATLLIRRARKLYCNDSFGVDLTNTVYTLDATTIGLCLSLFPWAPFRTSKAAQTAYTLLDLRGNIPAFIHITMARPTKSTCWIPCPSRQGFST